MQLALLSIVAGLIILVLSASCFIDGAAALARRFGVPPLLVGIVVIGIGTSMPELLVSGTAAIHGTSGIALGNAYGSNIGNILLILGVSSLISPLSTTRAVVGRELPILLVVTGFAVFLLWDGEISRFDAALMVLAYAACVFISVRQAMADSKKPVLDAANAEFIREVESELPPKKMSARTATMRLLVGLAGMVISSELLVTGSVTIARHFGVSDLVIGLTIVAIGTCLPELASSVIASRKGEGDLAMGNVLGSNTFNTLMVVGVAGLISPLKAEAAFLERDLPVAVAATVLLYVFCRGRKGPGVITRGEGAVLILLYAAYTAYLMYTAVEMPAAA